MPSTNHKVIKPSPESLRRRAKILAQQVRAGETEAVKRYVSVWENIVPATHVSLQRVQHVVAIEGGFKSWNEMLSATDELSSLLSGTLEFFYENDDLLNIFPQAPITLITGISGSGKTATMEALVLNQCLKGRPVMWASPCGGCSLDSIIKDPGLPELNWQTFDYMRMVSSTDPVPSFDSVPIVSKIIELASTRGKKRGILVIDEAWKLIGNINSGRACEMIIAAADYLDVVLISQSLVDYSGLRESLQGNPFNLVTFKSSGMFSEAEQSAFVGFPTPPSGGLRTAYSHFVPNKKADSDAVGYAEFLLHDAQEKRSAYFKCSLTKWGCALYATGTTFRRLVEVTKSMTPRPTGLHILRQMHPEFAAAPTVVRDFIQRTW